METKENALSAFSEETLNEMAMENLEGGSELGVNIPNCGTKNDGCGSTNNCTTGNCAPGCGVPAPIDDLQLK